MKLPAGPLDGAQPRAFVLEQLAEAGVQITQLDEGEYELVDLNGDPEVLYLDDPILARMITHLWRRFGQLHSMIPQDLVYKPTAH